MVVQASALDDGVYSCGNMGAQRWVETLAVMKAEEAQKVCDLQVGTILACDTMCEVDNSLQGQPDSADSARKMLLSMVNGSHHVYTGWCLLSVDGSCMKSGCEQAMITFGSLCTEKIEKYIESEQWIGKAGAYNLSERIDDGWPISFEGDPTSVMGLPMILLQQELSWDTRA